LTRIAMSWSSLRHDAAATEMVMREAHRLALASGAAA
jgi:hypothetical protein